MDRHRLAYAALSAIHGALALILALEGATAHAVCALLAALAYAALCRSPDPAAAAGGQRRRPRRR